MMMNNIPNYISHSDLYPFMLLGLLHLSEWDCYCEIKKNKNKNKRWITAPNLLKRQHFEKNISNSNISLKWRLRKISWEVLGAIVYPQNNHFGTKSPFLLQYLLSTSLLCLNSITMFILPLYYLWPPSSTIFNAGSKL